MAIGCFAGGSFSQVDSRPMIRGDYTTGYKAESWLAWHERMHEGKRAWTDDRGDGDFPQPFKECGLLVENDGSGGVW